VSTFGSFEEFWAAMGRLYDQTLKHEALIAENAARHEALIAENAAHIAQLREAQELTNRQMQATDARLDRLVSTVATLAGTVAKVSEEIESHERRLGRLEGYSG
jgi:predicted  nucleic acid-binding Zn-ribbon protein